jgi:hypothetical protein
MAHTPGPWDWEPEGDGENCASEPYVYAQNVDHRDGKQPLIALCYVPTSLQNRYYGVDVDSEEVANARLIAAAPELLEALENCLGFVVAHPQLTEDLRNLIAKARGES